MGGKLANEPGQANVVVVVVVDSTRFYAMHFNHVFKRYEILTSAIVPPNFLYTFNTFNSELDYLSLVIFFNVNYNMNYPCKSTHARFNTFQIIFK